MSRDSGSPPNPHRGHNDTIKARRIVTVGNEVIALSFFFDELFAMRGLVRGDHFFSELVGNVIVV